MSPIPSGLVVSADLDTSNINKGLVSYVENVDEFSYSVVAKDLKNGFSAVAWDSYVLTDHNNTSTKKETDEQISKAVAAADHLKRKVVANLDEAKEYMANNDDAN